MLTEKQKAMVDTLATNYHNVTEASKKVGIDRTTHHRWYNEIPLYKKACDDVKFALVERAETILHDRLDRDTTALLFFLKCKGGYSETTKVEKDVKKEIIFKRL